MTPEATTVLKHPIERGYCGCRTKDGGAQYCKTCRCQEIAAECQSVRKAIGATLIIPRKEAVTVYHAIDEVTKNKKDKTKPKGASLEFLSDDMVSEPGEVVA